MRRVQAAPLRPSSPRRGHSSLRRVQVPHEVHVAATADAVVIDQTMASCNNDIINPGVHV